MMTGEEQPRRAPPGLLSSARNGGGLLAGEELRGRAPLDVPPATQGCGGVRQSLRNWKRLVVVLVPIGGAVGGDGESMRDADGPWLVAGTMQPAANPLEPGVVPGGQKGEVA